MMPDGREMRVPKPEIFLGKLRKTGPERSFEAFRSQRNWLEMLWLIKYHQINN